MKRALKLREKLERAIESALAILDEIDGDPDLEPSLGQRCYGAKDVDLEEEYHLKPPKGYMHPGDLLFLTNGGLGVKP